MSLYQVTARDDFVKKNRLKPRERKQLEDLKSRDASSQLSADIMIEVMQQPPLVKWWANDPREQIPAAGHAAYESLLASHGSEVMWLRKVMQNLLANRYASSDALCESIRTCLRNTGITGKVYNDPALTQLSKRALHGFEKLVSDVRERHLQEQALSRLDAEEQALRPKPKQPKQKLRLARPARTGEPPKKKPKLKMRRNPPTAAPAVAAPTPAAVPSVAPLESALMTCRQAGLNAELYLGVTQGKVRGTLLSNLPLRDATNLHLVGQLVAKFLIEAQKGPHKTELSLFLSPVSLQAYPDYARIVPRNKRMDLGTLCELLGGVVVPPPSSEPSRTVEHLSLDRVQQRLLQSCEPTLRLRTLGDAVAQQDKIWAAALLYNGSDNVVGRAAQSFRGLFYEVLDRWLLKKRESMRFAKPVLIAAVAATKPRSGRASSASSKSASPVATTARRKTGSGKTPFQRQIAAVLSSVARDMQAEAKEAVTTTFGKKHVSLALKKAACVAEAHETLRKLRVQGLAKASDATQKMFLQLFFSSLEEKFNTLVDDVTVPTPTPAAAPPSATAVVRTSVAVPSPPAMEIPRMDEHIEEAKRFLSWLFEKVRHKSRAKQRAQNVRSVRRTLQVPVQSLLDKYPKYLEVAQPLSLLDIDAQLGGSTAAGMNAETAVGGGAASYVSFDAVVADLRRLCRNEMTVFPCGHVRYNAARYLQQEIELSLAEWRAGLSVRSNEKARQKAEEEASKHFQGGFSMEHARKTLTVVSQNATHLQYFEDQVYPNEFDECTRLHYYQVVQNPLTFDSVRRRLRALQYTHWQQFLNDGEQVFINAIAWEEHRRDTCNLEASKDRLQMAHVLLKIWRLAVERSREKGDFRGFAQLVQQAMAAEQSPGDPQAAKTARQQQVQVALLRPNPQAVRHVLPRSMLESVPTLHRPHTLRERLRQGEQQRQQLLAHRLTSVEDVSGRVHQLLLPEKVETLESTPILRKTVVQEHAQENVLPAQIEVKAAVRRRQQQRVRPLAIFRP